MSDLISRQALCEYALNQKDKRVTPNDIMRFPSAPPEPDKKKISDLLIRLYILGIVHLNKEGIRRRQHYCEELWKALFHDDELPVWMHWL